MVEGVEGVEAAAVAVVVGGDEVKQCQLDGNSNPEGR
jgi:hypothetical protein